MLSWVCVLLGLVALAAAQFGSEDNLTADSSLEERYTGESADTFRRRHFYVSSIFFCFACWDNHCYLQCLDVDQSIENFPQREASANADEEVEENLWAIFLQYPILSYLDSTRKENLFNIIARLVQIGAPSGGLADFNESNICVANVYHYGVSTFEES